MPFRINPEYPVRHILSGYKPGRDSGKNVVETYSEPYLMKSDWIDRCHYTGCHGRRGLYFSTGTAWSGWHFVQDRDVVLFLTKDHKIYVCCERGPLVGEWEGSLQNTIVKFTQPLVSKFHNHP